MRSISKSDITRRDGDGVKVVDPQRLVYVLEELRKEVEDLEQRLNVAEADISDLEEQ